MNNKDKDFLLNSLIQQLEAELLVMKQASTAAQEAATHEESRAENQYDTRGLEASYLAAAQLQRSLEIESGISGLKKILAQKITNQEIVNIGSLVALELEGKINWFFMLPFAAGATVKIQNHTITVISPQSPVGKELMLKSKGDFFTVRTAGKEKDYELIELI